MQCCILAEQRPWQQRETRVVTGFRLRHTAAVVAKSGQAFPSHRHCEEA